MKESLLDLTYIINKITMFLHFVSGSMLPLKTQKFGPNQV